VRAGGTQTVLAGGLSAEAFVSSGGTVNVFGSASGAGLFGGTENVSAGGVAYGNTGVYGGGNQNVYNGGTASGTQVDNGGTQTVYAGGSATSTTVNSGGTLQLLSGGSATDAILNSGGAIDLTNLAYASGGSAGLDPSVPNQLDVSVGGVSFTEQLAGNYTGQSFQLSADAAGGTTIVELCYLKATRILTPLGEVAVEDLRIGDSVVTRWHGIQTIKWIGRQSYTTMFVANNPDKIPVRIKQNALGNRSPARDLFVSPGHSMLVDETLVLAKSLVNGITILQECLSDEIHFFQLDLGIHDCVIAEGAWSETFADGPGLREQFHNAAEFSSLYPNEAPPGELTLCAARPQNGPKLDAVLRPVVARAAAKLKPGLLRGSIDRVTAPWTIEGWAQDTEYPELPLLLEVLLDDAVIATTLACDFRSDLEAAGIGRGRCAFFLTSPVRLEHEQLTRLRIRRAADHAEIPMTAACMDEIEAARPTVATAGLRRVA
jgi:autotransporter passenger strand-loop-strand repeat protein